MIPLFAAALAAAPVAGADNPAPDPQYPLAQGNYTTEQDPGWVYFVVDFPMKPDLHDFFGCGIGPDGTVGCDRVPHPDQYPLMEPATYPPPGTNQTVATAAETASYRFSLTPTFTREVDVLPEGRMLVNGDASCWRGLQGTMACRSGEHGFRLSYTWGQLN
jgi:hypothetical protein